MKKLYLSQRSFVPRALIVFLVIFLNSSFIAFAQDPERRLIQGILRDETGDPMPGVNVVIKGTAIGTVTDIEGFYSIEASVGDILVYSSVGFVTYEVKVAEQNSDPINNTQKEYNPEDYKAYKKRSYTQDNSKRNTLHMDQDSHVFRFNYKNSSRWTIYGKPIDAEKTYNFLPSSIKRIRHINPKKLTRNYGIVYPDGIYEISERRSAPYINNIGLMYNTSFSATSPYRFTPLQNQFVQGRLQHGQVEWQGPETGEIFSWGPEISFLEFDGQPYPYDLNGKLVPTGFGNGTPANAYDHYDFLFRNGQTIHNYLKLSLPILDNLTSEVDFDHGLSRPYIPGSESEKMRSGLKLKYRGYQIEIDGNMSYGKSSQTLPIYGSSHASIFSSMMRTPSSFDNANGQSGKSAIKNPNSHLLEDGTQRSHAVNFADNPFWLVNNLPDKNEQSHLVAGIKVDTRFLYDFELSLTASYNTDQLHRQFGIAPNSSEYPNGRFTSRNQYNKLFNSLIEAQYRHHWSGFQLDVGVQNIITGDSKKLDRTDELNLSLPGELVLERQFTGERWSSEPGLLAKMQFGPGYYGNMIKVNLYLNSYFSSTLNKNIYLLPSLGASIDVDELLNLGNVISGVEIRGQFANSVKEAPLLYPSLSFNTLNFRSDDYSKYFENEEIALINPQEIRPESHSKFETGIDLHFFYNTLNLQYNFYNNNVEDFIYPVPDKGKFNLKNIAEVSTLGHEIELELFKPTHSDFDISSRLIFHSFNQKVQKLYSQQTYIPIVGFSDIFGIAMPDQPLGTLYGSKFLRNSRGQVIIDSDGYPLVDSQPGILGNPNPDWTGGLETTLYIKWFTLSFLVETSQGGKIWNGTSNVLNYLGRSTETAQLRNTTNYVFEGVNEADEPNIIPVNFNDPELPLSENRWVRYGFSGVAEEAIEDASWTKLSEIKLSYKLSDIFKKLVNRRLDGTISIFAKDLFMITGYSGSNPAGTLFSYPSLSGFDLFNAPMTQTFGFSLTLKNN